MRFHSVDYREERGESPRALVHRGFWGDDLPRLIPACRLLGHVPVVDGYDPPPSFSRWVTCDRCGVRPEPQGSLDPAWWSVGDPYDGPCRGVGPDGLLPGPWPIHPVGVLGGEVVIGRTFSGVSFQVKVGNAGSEHTLAAHARVGPLGALYLHTERFGTWLQRRLNPAGYHSRVVGLHIEDARLRWELWAKRHEWSSDDPAWMQGSVRIDPRDVVLGERRYSYADVGDRVPAVVRMPHGDDYVVTLQLQRQMFGRDRGPKRETWVVDWECEGSIPTKPGGRGRVNGSGVKVSEPAEAGLWVGEATAAIAHALAGDRARHGYRPDHAAA